MEEGLKYFMLTDVEERFADIFSDLDSFKKAFVDLRSKLSVRAWLLTPTTGHADIYLAKLEGKLVACLEPKRYVGGDYVGCKKQEIKLNV